MYHTGVWGTVCDDGWGFDDAQVVCRELGFTGVTGARYNAYYGQGSGQIWLRNLRCVGTESTVGDCSHDGWGYTSSCRHYDDAGVKCNGGMYKFINST